VATTPASTVGTVTPVSDVQVCAECAGKRMPAKFEGTATVKNGVQVIDVAIVEGTYAPNVITAQAGMETQVVFTGRAKGCLAKPTFKALGKSADVTASGTATIDLGTLKPGVYKFTCGMGMNAATITVR
jgi:plastocyanin domain-containing protein